MMKLPKEIIDLITKYLDYKSLHKKNFQKVLNTLQTINGMIQISPSIVKENWGSMSVLDNYNYIYNSRYIWNPRIDHNYKGYNLYNFYDEQQKYYDYDYDYDCDCDCDCCDCDYGESRI